MAAAACTSGDTGASPALDEAVVVPAEAIRVIGASESLARVRDVKLGAGDTIWVLNSAEPFLVAFSPGSGHAPARAWGKRGSGPREFSSPGSLARGPDGDVWVYDQAKHALIRANGSEDDWTEIALPRDSLPPAYIVGSDQIGMMRPWIASRGDAFVFAVTSVAEPAAPRMWNARLVSFDPVARAAATVFSTREGLSDPTTRWPALTILMPHPLWDVCRDGSVVAYDPIRNSILRFVDGAAAGPPITLPAERQTRVTPDRMFGVAYRDAMERFTSDQRPDSAAMRRQMDAEIQNLGEQFGTVFPEYADLRCVPGDGVWIQLFDTDAGYFGKGRVWLRGDANGATRGIRLPDRFTPFHFLDDRVLGVLKDEYDVAMLAVIEMGEVGGED